MNTTVQETEGTGSITASLNRFSQACRDTSTAMQERLGYTHHARGHGGGLVQRWALPGGRDLKQSTRALRKRLEDDSNLGWGAVVSGICIRRALSKVSVKVLQW